MAALSLASLVPALATLLIVRSKNRGIWVNSNCMMPIACFLKTGKTYSNAGMGKHTCSNIHTDELPRAKAVLVPDMFVVLFIFYEKPIDVSVYLLSVTFIGSKSNFHWALLLIYCQCSHSVCRHIHFPSCTKFRMPSSSCLLVNALLHEPQVNFCLLPCILVYILLKIWL